MQFTKEQRDILIKTAEYMANRENNSDYSENIRKVAEIALVALQSFGNSEQLEPVSEPYKLPPNSFTDDELEAMAHGNNPQANAYRELLARRNSPVTPDGWVMVPVEPTAEMRDAWFFMEDFDAEWRSILAAAPKEMG